MTQEHAKRLAKLEREYAKVRRAVMDQLMDPGDRSREALRRNRAMARNLRKNGTARNGFSAANDGMSGRGTSIVIEVEREAEKLLAGLIESDSQAPEVVRLRRLVSEIDAIRATEDDEPFSSPDERLERVRATAEALRTADYARHKAILDARNAGLSLRVIGAAAGLTGERVRQLCAVDATRLDANGAGV